MAEAVQAAPGAQPAGGHAQRQAGGAVQQAGGWLHVQHHHQDVCRAGEFVTSLKHVFVFWIYVILDGFHDGCQMKS